MRYLTRTIIVFVVFCMATASFAPAQTSPEGKRQTCTISGNAGTSGVTIKGLPVELVTDQNGFYSATVDYGWSGTVTPTKEGYLFVPVCKIYHNVNSDRANEDYAPKIITLIISGKVGMIGVTMVGLPGNPVTDNSFSYNATVEYGWSGTVTPIMEGFSFEPASKVYQNVISDRANDNYQTKLVTNTISGQVGIPGVEMQGLPRNPVTDESGYYTSTVNYGWAGTVKPVKEGYTFNPPRLSYTKVFADQKNDDYTPKIITNTISGQVEIPGVVMQGLPGNPVTDENGLYSATVEYGWRGKITPVKEGFSFNPGRKSYLRVLSDMTDEDYVPRLISNTISGAVATEGVVIKGLPGLPITGKDGKYRASVEYGWSGTVTPTKAGYVFDPPHRQYSKIKENQPNQDFWPKFGPSAIFGRSGGRKVLVVPAAEVKAEDLAEIIEDMQVMAHILDERFKETRRVQGAFTDFGDFFGRDNRTTEAIYLQGYGVLFLMEVNFAFSPPPKPQGQGAEQTAENVDSTWQRARQQVFSPGDPRNSRGSNSAEEYNSQMVEELKRDLITTLKHAANIRGVQIDEWIILTVIGGGRQSGGVFGGRGAMMGSMGGFGSSSTGGGGMMAGVGGGGMGGGMMGRMGGGGMGGGMMGGGYGGGGMGGGMMGGGMGGMTGFDEMGVSPATVLTIRAAKCDVDAFAKGQQDYEQFRQKVQIFTY